ncbi:hypothetical protein LSUE1_G001009 [Lachnellula suecica]|uniref:Gfd2/YDR514C-like C-terminal domain-containing protein n=1 Tax=Lachnellula suecica TaxID=602035 RepID=A0A8T9CEF3_9HELO|nr:hypothetical protein LSUE1_G001009 [Lachnellula suecica]
MAIDPEIKPKRTAAFYQQLLQGSLGLPLTSDTSVEVPCQYPDAILVSIDFENGDKIEQCMKSGNMEKKLKIQAGVSILDTRDLSSSSSPPQETLKTYNIVLGHSSYKKHSERKFLFGKTEWLCGPAHLLNSIEKLVDRTRNIILVGHGLIKDHRVLKALGFDFKTSISGILDTQQMAYAILGKPEDRGSLRLKGVLEKLDCTFEGYHSAGNDANFTLRALLLLAVEDYSGHEESLDDGMKKRLENIKALGRSQLPIPVADVCDTELN